MAVFQIVIALLLGGAILAAIARAANRTQDVRARSAPPTSIDGVPGPASRGRLFLVSSVVVHVGQHGKYGRIIVMESGKPFEGLSGQYTSRPASAVKAHWRDIVDEVNAIGEVVVTSYDRPEVVVMSIDRYTRLRQDSIAHDPLTTLRADFDRELAMLRDANAAPKLRKVFASTPAEVARAASAAGRRRER